MQTKRTNKDVLVLGLKRLGIAIVLLFAGPTLLYVVVSNKEKPFYIPLLIISFVICALAIYFIFKGIKTLISSVFDWLLIYINYKKGLQIYILKPFLLHIILMIKVVKSIKYRINTFLSGFITTN